MNDPGALHVSRETAARLEIHAALLQKWNRRINLVSRATLDDLWRRHVADSAQIFGLAPHPVAHWADFGSGGGFPGLVVAIMAKETGSPAHVTLVESDARKCAFLRTVIRETGAPARVVNDRIEKIDPLRADVVSARALASLSRLLGFAERHLAPEGVAIFLKGTNWRKELSQAKTGWKFTHRAARSKTATGPVILSIAGVARV